MWYHRSSAPLRLLQKKEEGRGKREEKREKRKEKTRRGEIRRTKFAKW